MWKIYLWSWRIGIHLATQKRCVLPYLTVFLRIFSTYLMKNKILTKNLHRISHFFIYCYFDCWYCIHRRKVMTHPDSILKSRDITLPTKVHLVKALVFPVVMYGCESWTIKKADPQRIDAFELWCWKTLESPLDCKAIKPISPKGSQPWIFIGRTDAEAPILWPPEAKKRLTGKDPDAGMIEGGRRRVWQRMRCLDGITNSMGAS